MCTQVHNVFSITGEGSLQLGLGSQVLFGTQLLYARAAKDLRKGAFKSRLGGEVCFAVSALQTGNACHVKHHVVQLHSVVSLVVDA